MRGRGSILAALVLLTPAPIVAQDFQDLDWRLLVRAGVTGTSYDSDPSGYKIYSGVAFDVGVARRVVDAFWVEVAVRTESREVEGPVLSGYGDHLGSLEMLPVHLVVQWHPLASRGTRFQPYAGGGFAATLTWEKSGALDSADVPLSLGPALQVGALVELSTRAALVLDVKWNTLRVDVEGLTTPTPHIDIDPLTLGLGVAVTF